MNNKNIQLSSNKLFGVVFGVIFLIISLWPLKSSGDIIIWSLIISLIFFILGLLNSEILTPLHYLWLKFGFFLSKIVSPVIMFIIFFGLVSPIGIFMRLIGKDLLNLKKKPLDSYWINRKPAKQNMKDQF
ncbi:SxtJ family membrane protein [bacterium]|nr:SxtJ family membrane protein [bacterium]